MSKTGSANGSFLGNFISCQSSPGRQEDSPAAPPWGWPGWKLGLKANAVVKSCEALVAKASRRCGLSGGSDARPTGLLIIYE